MDSGNVYPDVITCPFAKVLSKALLSDCSLHYKNTSAMFCKITQFNLGSNVLFYPMLF